MTDHAFNPALSLQDTQFLRSGLLSAREREAVAEIAIAPRCLKAHIDVVAEGACADQVYFLIQGWACRYKITSNGARQIIGLVLPGEVCNLDSFMLAQLDFGVRTLTTAMVVGLPRNRLQALAAERFGVARAITWFAIIENAILGQWALSLGRKSARERLAHLLCELSVRLGDEHEMKMSFELPTTQEQIADVLGLTTVHVNRVLQQLKAEGLIVAENRRLTVIDMAQLSRVGGFDGSYLHATALPNAGRRLEQSMLHA